ncbi:hypothetical protein A9K66_21820 [Mesorhizobium sp. AA23]|nr:hypothetical protein A9K66_21820 [Mesorhizobium sp. AA23]
MHGLQVREFHALELPHAIIVAIFECEGAVRLGGLAEVAAALLLGPVFHGLENRARHHHLFGAIDKSGRRTWAVDRIQPL